MKRGQKISKKFIGFLFASMLIWLLITLSKEYVTVTAFPVVYKNLPQDKLMQTAPIKNIELQIKATGFKIIRTNFMKKPIVLNANNLSKKGKGYYFLPNSQKNNIQKELISEVALLEVYPDTIHLDLGVLMSKKVPVTPNLDIKYHIGYDVLESIKIDPDSIVISGPDSQIHQIKSIGLHPLKLENVKSDFTKKIAVKTPENLKNVKLNTEFVIVSGKVEKFTEGSLNVPFKVVNISDKTQLNMLTKTVEIVFVVGLSNFNKIDKNSFKVECDFSISEKNNLGYLLPKVVSKPNFIKSFRIIPNKIDFLIQK